MTPTSEKRRDWWEPKRKSNKLVDIIYDLVFGLTFKIIDKIFKIDSYFHLEAVFNGSVIHKSPDWKSSFVSSDFKYLKIGPIRYNLEIGGIHIYENVKYTVEHVDYIVTSVDLKIIILVTVYLEQQKTN